MHINQILEKIQLDFNWILNFAPHPSKFLIFETNELLSAKTKEFKTN